MKQVAPILLVAALSLVAGAAAGITYARHFMLPTMVKNTYINALVLNGTMDVEIMELVALGRTDVLYNRAESGAMFCLLPGPIHDLTVDTLHGQDHCTDRLRAFYRQHPERVPHLQEELPRQAAMLGFTPGR